MKEDAATKALRPSERRYAARKLGGRVWRVYDHARGCYPVLLAGVPVRQDLNTEVEAQAEADRLERGLP